jgi:hypothetical protein
MIIRCDNCNKEFSKPLSKIKKNKNHFCSTKCKGESLRLNLVGQKFGELEVLEFDCINSDGNSKFKCKCSCGRIVSMLGIHLRRENKKCKTCCIRKYVGEVSGVYFSSLKHSAIKRGISVEITQKDIWDKFIEQDRKCALSKIELTWKDGYKDKLGTASVDRKDSKIGYTKDNIQIVHKDINKMKNNLTEEYFIDLCRKVAENAI